MPDRDSFSQSDLLETRITEALRRIVRASDMTSRAIFKEHRLSGPQLAILQQVAASESATVSSLAKAVHVGAPTVTGILDRLERDGLIRRVRDVADRRQVIATATESGRQVLGRRPSLLNEHFRGELQRLEEWERTLLLSMLQRAARMMEGPEGRKPARRAAPPAATEPTANHASAEPTLDRSANKSA
jgi:DNA-binding MarR family transcriptional regulator